MTSLFKKLLILVIFFLIGFFGAQTLFAAEVPSVGLNPIPLSSMSELPGEQVPVPVSIKDSIAWDYLDIDLTGSGVTVTQFVLCLDSQATSACAKVPATSTVTIQLPGGPGKTYQWKLPAILPGPHTVTAQACDASLQNCSSGSALSITFVPVLSVPLNIRLVKGS